MLKGLRRNERRCCGKWKARKTNKTTPEHRFSIYTRPKTGPQRVRGHFNLSRPQCGLSPPRLHLFFLHLGCCVFSSSFPTLPKSPGAGEIHEITPSQLLLLLPPLLLSYSGREPHNCGLTGRIFTSLQAKAFPVSTPCNFAGFIEALPFGRRWGK